MKNKSQKKQEIYSKVLKKITPTKNEIKEEKEIVKKIKKKVEELEGKHSHLEWCGSSARGTHLSGDRDLDLFVMFDKELNEKELEKEGLRIGKNVFRGHKWEKAYSQHPYIRGNINGFEIEIVPGYIVNHGGEIKSAVDRTPFHNKYLLKNMSNKQKEHARLLKQFLKGINAYGADLKNESLPGYGVELLVLYYESFEKTLKAITTWKLNQTIKFSNKGATFIAPLVIIDPVDENRNVASALSLEQFQRIVYATKKFLEKPSIKFFFPIETKPMKKIQVKKMLDKKELIAIKMDFPKNVLSDLVWGQLRRALKKGETLLNENDFSVQRNTLWSNEEEVWLIYELETLTLQKAKKVIGPNIEDEENVKKFLEKKRKILAGPRIEGKRMVIEIEREKTKADEILQELIKDMKRNGKKAMKNSFRGAKVTYEKDLLKEYKGEFAKFFSNYLKGRERFE